MVPSSETLRRRCVPTKLNPGKLACMRMTEVLVWPFDFALGRVVQTFEPSAAANLNLDAMKVAGGGRPPIGVNRLARIDVILCVS